MTAQHTKTGIIKIIIACTAMLFAAAIPRAAQAAEVPTSPQNGIPLVIIRVAEQELQEEGGDRYGTIADMNGDPDHNTRCHGTVEILLPDGYASEYGGTVPAGEIELKYIRGRGLEVDLAGEDTVFYIAEPLTEL